MTRTDIHRTSAVIPADYDFVAFCYARIADFAGFLPAVVSQNTAILQAHMAKTGGQFSQHEHGGTCHICGAWAIYTVIFWHRATNVYIRTGYDCAEKMQMSCGNFNAFQRAIHDAREAIAGKMKAKTILAERGLGEAWALYSGETKIPDGPMPYEERTIIDIVSRLVKYGNASEKALNFVQILLNKIPERTAKQAQWAAEKAAAKPAPTGRMTFTATVIKVAVYDSQFGSQLKMTVKHADGWLAFGTVPRSMNPERGDMVTLTATLTPSDKDPVFAFFSRPTAGTAASKAAVAAVSAVIPEGRFFRQ